MEHLLPLATLATPAPELSSLSHVLTGGLLKKMFSSTTMVDYVIIQHQNIHE
jgi:hypothetical protein